MRAEDWPRFAALLDEALELEPEQRGAWLGGLRGPDRELRAQLEQWLADEAGARGFLEAPLAPGTSWSRAPWAPRPAGELIGRYRILRVIGVGGTSVVYEAEQQEPRRAVALKVFQAGLAGDRSRLRFAEEASILASLRHPGVAQVFEAGTEEPQDDGRPGEPAGLPWIAMELVPDARPITRHAREARLGQRARLELFATVCDAIAHGHERGVIHQDLKPANLLVGMDGGPKVIDFGVARMLAGGPGVEAPTADGLGTVPWMSPERLSGSESWPDTRSDVYALGVVLYELLCDALPHALDGLSLEAALRTVREGPVPRVPGIDRDLEAIVTVALARDPEERYPAAGELAADLRRYLAQEPVVARPPSVLHHLRLVLARRRGALAAAAGTLVLLAGVLALGAVRTARVEARERAAAAGVTEFLESVLALASPSQSPRADLTMREVLDDAARRIEVELAEAPAARARVHALVGSAWRELGQLDRAEEHLRSSLEVLRATRPGSVELAGGLSMLSEVLLAGGRAAEAEQVLLEARELYSRSPDTPEFFLGIVTNKLAGAKRLRGELDAAQRLSGEALAIYRRAFGESHVAVASAFDTLATIQLDAGRPEAAEHSARQALRIHLETADPSSLAVAQARVALARVLLRSGQPPEALELLLPARVTLERLLPPEHPERVQVGELIERCQA